jgi:threonine dehydrogenase-like Zn-dependent dehydrogenase
VGKKVSLDVDQIVYNEIEFTATFAHVWQAWPRALALVASGAVQTEPLVSHRFPLSKWQDAFEKFASREGVKILLEPEE